MYIESTNFVEKANPNMRGGDGTVLMNMVQEEMPKNCRLFSEIKLNPGCGIGEHVHENEAELFYVVEGECLLTDNGKAYKFKEGDAHICYAGSSHSVKNVGDKPFKLLAVIITE